MSKKVKYLTEEQKRDLACEHPNLREWDCACSFGCDCCGLNYECPDCGNKFKQRPPKKVHHG